MSLEKPAEPPINPQNAVPESLETTVVAGSEADQDIPVVIPTAASAQARAVRVSRVQILPPEKPHMRLIQPALSAAPDAQKETPWTLQQFFDGEIDLDVELAKRFPSMPMMATISTRTLGAKGTRRVATLATQDGAASVIIDADVPSRSLQISFSLSSMLTLRFALADLSEADRTRWLELMRREQGGLAFLWGPARWSSDYLICIARRYFTNLYAFSPDRFEASVRLTPVVTQQLLDWLDELWKETPAQDDEPPQLLTW